MTAEEDRTTLRPKPVRHQMGIGSRIGMIDTIGNASFFTHR